MNHRQFASREEFEAFAERIYAEHSYRFGDWSFNWVTCQVLDRGKVVKVTEREGDVLKALLEVAPEPVRSVQLVAGFRKLRLGELDPADVKTYIRRLRDKIGRERIITTSTGYAFVPFVESP